MVPPGTPLAPPLFAPHTFGVVLRAHSVRGELRIQHNASEEVATSAVQSESRSRSRKDFQPEESESQKILTTPGRPFAHQF